MKKSSVLLLVLALLLSLAACGSPAAKDKDGETSPPRVSQEAPTPAPEDTEEPVEQEPVEEPTPGTSGEVSYEVEGVLITAVLPETGWYSEKRSISAHLFNVSSENEAHSGAPRIQVEIKETPEKFDFYKDDFENLADIPNRTIGGLTMVGRTYKNIGMDWTEYVGVIDETHAVSVKISKVDISDGSEGSAVLDSIRFG